MTLHYADDGPRDAPALVFAGSLGATLSMWEPQLTLAGPFRVIRIDHRGHGGSPVPPGPYAMPDLAADVLSLLDELGLARVAFCGLSLGGMVGMYLGSEHPERLTSLVLCCTSAHFTDRRPWLDRIAAVEAGGTASVADAVVSRWFTPAWGAAHPDVVAALRNQIADTPDQGYLGCCRAIATWDHRERLGAVAVPTLVIGGADDPSIPVEPHARTLVEGIPGARLEVLPGAHLTTIESAEQATRLISGHAAVTTE
jgi:3-oxoadipate enol-lactonase